MRMVGREGVVVTSLVRRELDRLVGHLVDDVERLERPALPSRLLLYDANFFLAVHRLGLGRRAARAVVRQGRHAELEARALDAAEELALTRRPNALGAVRVQTQVAAEAPVDEDQVRPMRGYIRTIAAARRGGDGRREETSFSALVLTRPRLGP